MSLRYRLHYMTAPTVPNAFAEVRVPSCYHTPSAFVYYDRLPSFVALADVVRMSKSRAVRL